jgi:hypothetical protein
MEHERDSLTKILYTFLYHSKAWKILLLFYIIRFLKYNRFRIEFSNIRRSAVRFYKVTTLLTNGAT